MGIRVNDPERLQLIRSKRENDPLLQEKISKVKKCKSYEDQVAQAYGYFDIPPAWEYNSFDPSITYDTAKATVQHLYDFLVAGKPIRIDSSSKRQIMREVLYTASESINETPSDIKKEWLSLLEQTEIGSMLAFANETAKRVFRTCCITELSLLEEKKRYNDYDVLWMLLNGPMSFDFTPKYDGRGRKPQPEG